MNSLGKPQPRTLSNAPGMLTDKIFTVGTLSYTKGTLQLLFAWLVWNDLCLMLMENVAPSLVPLLMKDHGAANHDIAFFTSTLTGSFTIWINPVVSTVSDRFRSPFGRRRPFLLAATPFCAIFLAAIPFMPDLFDRLQSIPAYAHFFVKHTSVGLVSFIGLGYLFYQIFNSVITAIFTYYFWDVVPVQVLGRFSALTKVVSNISNILWNFFIFGLSERHLKGVFVGVAAFFFVVYMVTVWQVKEGDYPPPSKEARPGVLAVVKSYFRDCYRPYYLWFIGANTIFQIGNQAGTYQGFFYIYTLHMTREALGHIKSLPLLLVVLVGYPMGSVVDRVKPGRMLFLSIFVYGVVDVIGYYMIGGYWSLFCFMGVIAVIVCSLQISMSVFTVEFFPREKLGQFCSANATMFAVVCMMTSPLVGYFFDWTQNYRYGFLWAALFYFLSVPFYMKAYFNWRRTRIDTGLPDSTWTEPTEEIIAVETQG